MTYASFLAFFCTYRRGKRHKSECQTRLPRGQRGMSRLPQRPARTIAVRTYRVREGPSPKLFGGRCIVLLGYARVSWHGCDDWQLFCT